MTPPQMIRAAADAVRKTIADPQYEFHRHTFHSPVDGTCLVCLAGCWMAQHLGAEPTAHLGPLDFPESYNQLHALDSINFGHLADAAASLKVQLPDGMPETVESLCHDEPEKYLRRLEEIATLWEKATQ